MAMPKANDRRQIGPAGGPGLAFFLPTPPGVGTLLAQMETPTPPGSGRGGGFAGWGLRGGSPDGSPPSPVGEIRMSQLTATPQHAEHTSIEKLCTSIRGKLQFMDYL